MNGNCSSMSGLYGTSSFSSNASNLSSNSSISTSLTSLNQYMNESDDILYENFYGCARFEPYSTRSDYDMFSWLASRHRLAPMPVHIQSNNDETILRWVAECPKNELICKLPNVIDAELEVISLWLWNTERWKRLTRKASAFIDRTSTDAGFSAHGTSKRVRFMIF